MDHQGEDSMPASGRGLRHQLARALHQSRALPALAGLRSLVRRDLRILAYHRVCEIPDPDAFEFDLALVSASPQAFRDQMELVRRRHHPMRFSDVLAALDAGRRLPRNAVVVTFDDGYDDNYRTAFPILRELGVPATFFVSTGHIDSGLPYLYDWLVHVVLRTGLARLSIPELGIDRPLDANRDARRAAAAQMLDRIKAHDAATQVAIIERLAAQSDMPRTPGHADCRPMSWDQLREMGDAGMEIASHGVTHRMLAKLPDAEITAEVAGSQSSIARELGAPTPVIAYPVGGFDAFDDRVIAAAKAAGFRLGCSYVAGTNRLPGAPPFALGRLAVESDMDATWFEAMLGIPEWFTYRPRARTS
jgi:peptidoglycan/xylan/chitin deacetylase (PgdA/CDA1 family)